MPLRTPATAPHLNRVAGLHACRLHPAHTEHVLYTASYAPCTAPPPPRALVCGTRCGTPRVSRLPIIRCCSMRSVGSGALTSAIHVAIHRLALLGLARARCTVICERPALVVREVWCYSKKTEWRTSLNSHTRTGFVPVGGPVAVMHPPDCAHARATSREPPLPAQWPPRTATSCRCSGRRAACPWLP